MEQVITNLLSNAGKYGQGQPVDVTVATDGAEARIVVRDRGIGIDPEDRQRIFQRFERAVSTANYSGFGLGLWIVAEIVKAMMGTIDVAGAVGQGSTFTVTFPLRAQPPEASAEGERPGG
jgi:signal transduction histidine kinase